MQPTMNDLKLELDWKPGEETYLITSEGGGGHKAAADAIQLNLGQKAEELDQGNIIHRVDILKSTLIPNFIAEKVTSTWDNAKKAGDIKKQENLLKGKVLGLVTKRTLADYIFFIPIFVKTFFTLLCNKKITRIIDTQPIGTSAVIKAARLVNFIFRRHIEVYKVMTDLPTDEAIHFSESAKKLSKNDKKIYKVLSTAPFRANEGESEKDYIQRMDAWWKEHFKLSLLDGQVKYIDPPLRPAFLTLKDAEKPQTWGIKVNSDEERDLIKSINPNMGDANQVTTKALNAKGKIEDSQYNAFSYNVNETDRVGIITIGSQANMQATKDYMQDVINYAKKKKEEGDETPIHLFVAAGRHVPNANPPSLFSELIKIVREDKEIPDNLHIIPMGFQSDNEIAAIMKRADFGIYGAGGMTTMEVNAVAEGKIFIHSDAKVTLPSKEDLEKGDDEDREEQIRQELLKGFALWEKGNAIYQRDTKGSQVDIVRPHEIFLNKLEKALA